MKKLYKSRKEKMFAGVCGGIAEYFDIDPVLVRVLFIIFTFIGGTGVIAYLVGLIVMPFPPTETAGTTAEASPTPPPSPTTPDTSDMDHAGPPPPAPAKTPGKGGLVFGIILLVLGAYFLMRNIPMFNHWYWWIRWNLSSYLIPGVLIVIGAILIANSKRKKENEAEAEG